MFTKIDNLKAVGGDDLPFNLDFYTEVQDLNYLLPLLSAEQKATTNTTQQSKFEALNTALISLIEDFALVGFETLAVEDRQSMASLLRAIDRASGYVFAGARATDEEGRTLNDEASVWAQAMSDQWIGKMDIRDVQERWLDRKDEMDELERKTWEEEARMAGALDGGKPAATAVRKDPNDGKQEKQNEQSDQERPKESGADDDEDDDEAALLDEQQRWQEEQRQKGSTGAAAVVRK